jgi:hypothetical protein
MTDDEYAARRLQINAFLSTTLLDFRWMVHTGKERRSDHEIPLGYRFLCEPQAADAQVGLGRMAPATLEEPIAAHPAAWGLDFTGEMELMLHTLKTFVPLEQQPAIAEQMATELARQLGFVWIERLVEQPL